MLSHKADTEDNILHRHQHFVFIATLFLAITSVAQAQGLKGTNYGPEEIQGRAPIPGLIPGKSDIERWQLFARMAPQLIHMSKEKVRTIFGQGAERKKNELTYQITQGNPKHSGSTACIELRIHFEKGFVEEYSVASLRWL